jgi:hypothetical protein
LKEQKKVGEKRKVEEERWIILKNLQGGNLEKLPERKV